MCFDFLPDGRLVIASGLRILRLERDGSLATHADLTGLSTLGWNEIVVDGRSNAYWPSRTAESSRPSTSRPTAAFRTGEYGPSSATAFPMVSASMQRTPSGAPTSPTSVVCAFARAARVLQTIYLDRGCFACMLGGTDRKTLLLVVTEWRGPAGMSDGRRTGQVLTVKVPVPGVGWP